MFEVIVGVATILGTVFAGLALKHSLKKKNSRQGGSKKILDEASRQQLQIKRIENNIPKYLPRLKSGKELMAIVGSAHTYSFDNDELTPSEAELIGGFFNKLNDWGDLGQDLDPGFRVQLSVELTNDIKELEDNGFFVFGAKEKQVLEGDDKISDWNLAIITVLHKNNENILKMGREEKEKQEFSECSKKNTLKEANGKFKKPFYQHWLFKGLMVTVFGGWILMSMNEARIKEGIIQSLYSEFKDNKLTWENNYTITTQDRGGLQQNERKEFLTQNKRWTPLRPLNSFAFKVWTVVKKIVSGPSRFVMSRTFG